MTTASVGIAPDAPPEPDSYDWPGIVAGLQRYLRLTATPVGMKMFETIEEMQEVERIRRPQFKHALDQLVAQARWLNFTLGVTMDDLIGAQCGAPVGLHPNEDDGEWRLRTTMTNVWFETDEDSILHQQAMDVMPYGRYAALALSPLATGATRPARRGAALRHAGADDHPDQRVAILGLQEVRVRLGRRVGLRRQLGSRAEDRRAVAEHPLLRRASFQGGGPRTTSC